MAIHLLNPKHPEDHPLAEAQFAQLSAVRGSAGNESALVQVNTEDEASFQSAVERIATRAVDMLNKIRRQGGEDVENIVPDASGSGGGAGDTADRAMRSVLRSALVEYLGETSKPPRDLIAWVTDRDLTNPFIRSLEVRVLLTRHQLSDLSLGLGRILDAKERARVSEIAFFDALQQLSAESIKNPDAIDVFERIGEAGILPGFIASLPYRSEVLELDRNRYASMTAEDRAGFFDRLTAKLSLYRKINERVDGWIALNPGASAARQVYPVQLDYLP